MKLVNKISDFMNSNNLSAASRIFFKSLLCGFVFCLALSLAQLDACSNDISDKVFRLHILANSDSEEDQSLKLEVRDEVLRLCGDMYGDDVSSKSDAEIILRGSLKEITSAAQQVVYSKGYDYPVKCEIVNMYFNNRVYDNITLPAGDYDAVRITIGEGKGHNWWCVMFPPICIGASDNAEEISGVLNDKETELVTGDYEIRFKIYEIYRDTVEKLHDGK